jgi:hypothetical protein
MRRIYYAYFVDLVAQPMFVKGALLSVLVGALASFVSFKAVATNIAHVELASIIPYILASLAQTELWNILLALGIIAILGSTLKALVPMWLFVRA